MKEALLCRVIEQAHQWSSSLLPDAELLHRFVTANDQAAFELIVRRHGSMVLGVGLRILKDHHRAEDVFQATFLILSRKVESIRDRESIAGWLYRVAYRVACRAKKFHSSHPLSETLIDEFPASESNESDSEITSIIDGEVNRLPDYLRLPIVLCYFRGQTTEEVAQIMGCPRGTVLSRLANARKRLQRNLRRRGITLSVGALAILAEKTSFARISTKWIETVVIAGSKLRLGTPMESLELSPTSNVLTQGTLHAMNTSKWKLALLMCLAIGLATTGAMGLFQISLPAEEGQEKKLLPKIVQKKSPPKEETDPSTQKALAKNRVREEVFGLQMEIHQLGERQLVQAKELEQLQANIHRVEKKYEMERQFDLAMLKVYQEAQLKHLNTLLNGDVSIDPENIDPNRIRADFDKGKYASLKEALAKQRERVEEREAKRIATLSIVTEEVTKKSQEYQGRQRSFAFEREMLETKLRLLTAKLHELEFGELIHQPQPPSDPTQQKLDAILRHLEQIEKEMREFHKK